MQRVLEHCYEQHARSTICFKTTADGNDKWCCFPASLFCNAFLQRLNKTNNHARLRLENFSIRLKIGFEMASTRHDVSTVKETSTTKPKPPSMYKVILLNDDYTPMEFVVDVIQRFFHKNREQATQIMLKVHTEGSGVCGVYPHDIAETKVNQVVGYAREHQHPLQCAMEEV